MKSCFLALALTTLVLSSASALACPDLSGTFVCAGDEINHGSTNQITQTQEGDVTTYRLVETQQGVTTTWIAITDGVERPEASDFGGTLTARYTCSGNSLIGNGQGSEPQVGTWSFGMTAQLDTSGNLFQTADTTFQGQTMHTARTCARSK